MENLPQEKLLLQEKESPDDFEHLGHDSSPLQEYKYQVAGDVLDLKHDTHEQNVKIDNDEEKKILDDLTSLSSAPFSTTTNSPPPSLNSNKMDSNLVDVNNMFSNDIKKVGETNLDKYLDDLLPPPKNLEQTKLDVNEFLEKERILKDLNNAKNEKGSTELLEKYSDKEDDDFDMPSLDGNKSTTLIDVEPVRTIIDQTNKPAKETFQDILEPQPELPKKDYPLDFDEVPVKDEIFKDIPKEEIKNESSKISKKDPDVTAIAPPVVPVKKADQSSPVKQSSTTKKITETEAFLCKMGLDAWFDPERLNPKVESLIYWRDPNKSGPVFGGVLLILLALTYFSFISVVAYLSLSILTGTIAFRVYKNVIQAVQKTGNGHPFKQYLELDISLPQDKIKEVFEVSVAHFNAAAVVLRRLFLVEDLFDSLKFGVFLWVLTYLGAWFNGMTLIIIAWVQLFTLPKVYEVNKTQIDTNLDFVRAKVAEFTTKVKAAIPIGKKPEEKKE